jgi:PAS domain S-box-containing protein
LSLPGGLEAGCGACLLYGAIQGLADALVLVDLRGRVFHVNRRAEQILGILSRGVEGRSLVPRLRHPGLIAFWKLALAETGPVTADLMFPGRATIRATASVCLSESGEPIGRALLLRDVTRDKEVQIELSASVARRLVEMARVEETEEAAPALTPRERQVLGLLALGMSNATIAARLHVSTHTVASHLKHLYPKLKISNRSQATAYAIAHGIRPPGR